MGKASASYRCAIYARFSTDLQRETSVEDQVYECRRAAAGNDWAALSNHVYSDSGVSGQKFQARIGLQRLLSAIEEAGKRGEKPFDLVLVDDSSRLAREPEIYHRVVNFLTHYNIGVYYCAQRLNSLDSSSEFAMGIFAIQDKAFITQLRHKVIRGQSGRMRKGQVPNGKTYGYDNVPFLDPTGKRGRYGQTEVLYCEYKINADEANVVRMIFQHYTERGDVSQIDVARRLNGLGIPAPSNRWKPGATWGHTTIQRILSNKKYIGVFEWGRTREHRNEQLGKRMERLPETEWTVYKDEELRIVPQSVWDIAQRKRAAIPGPAARGKIGGMKRKAYLLSGLLTCGDCGGTMSVVDGSDAKRRGYVKYGCGNHHYKGTCSNAVLGRNTHLEEDVLAIVERVMLDPRFVKDRVAEFRSRAFERLKKLTSSRGQTDEKKLRSEQAKLKKEIDNGLNTMMKFGDNESLSAKLVAKVKEHEAHLSKVEEQLKAFKRVDIEGIAVSFEARMKTFTRDTGKLLAKGGPEARHALSQVVSRIVATRTMTDARREWRRGVRPYKLEVEWKMPTDSPEFTPAVSVSRMMSGTRLTVDGLDSDSKPLLKALKGAASNAIN